MVIDKKINSASVHLRRLDPLDVSLELLHFGFRGLTADADRYLETVGLSRVHHRILYIIARTDGISVGDLAATLGVSTQALHRPLGHLQVRELVGHSRDPQRHRFKLLALTEQGREVEQTATNHERNAIGAALASTSPDGQDAWQLVMQQLAERLN